MKKNHSSDSPSIEKISFADTLEENPTIQWITENGRTLLYIFLVALVALIVLYKFALSNREKNELTFIRAENDYQAYIAKNQPEDLQKLNNLISNHPELHAKYDALIAQNLINQGQTAAARPYAESSLKRTESENRPFYLAYAETSLAIGEKKYEQALTQALGLKQLMEKESLANYGDVLYGLNLIRIGTLQKELNLRQDEAALWKEWKAYAATNQDNPDFANLITYFQEGKVSLNNYIEMRENLLSK